MKFYLYCFMLLFILLPDMAFTSQGIFIDNLNSPSSLSGEWHIKCDDRPEYAKPDYDDSAWDTVTLPGSMIDHVIKQTGRIKGVLWVRKILKVNTELQGESIGLILGRIANADETYFNGVTIGGMGKFPPQDHSMWNFPRHYLAPSGIVHYGEKNVIAIRIYYNIYAEILGEMSSTNFSDWQDEKENSYFSLITHSYLIISMALFLFILFLAFYINRPYDQEYLYYCLQIIFGFFIILDLCALWDIFPSTYMRLQIVAVSWVALNVCHIIFLHRMYQLNRKKTEFTLWIYLALWTFLIIFVSRKAPHVFGVVLISLLTILGFYHISCHVYAIIKKRPYAKIFIVFGVTVICCAMHDSFVYMGKFYGKTISLGFYTFDRMIFHYGAFFLFLGTALVLIYRFLILQDEIDELNRTLEMHIIENALLEKEIFQRKVTGRHIISEETEEKISKVIYYINDNYLDNLSREGLAASVDLHPDNLSKLFNAYKNMRIGDYINELRIRDAAHRLSETNQSVTDIAFSVGFESLRTFNRAFVKYIKTTPDKYRRKNK